MSRFEPRLAALGYEASAAPNTVCLKNSTASKALPVQWLAGLAGDRARNPELSLAHAVAFGDNPMGNDQPLTLFADHGMPFVSVASHAALEQQALPPGLASLHVGGLEHGSAAVLSRLVQEWRAAGEGTSWRPSDTLETVCAAARAEQAKAAQSQL